MALYVRQKASDKRQQVAERNGSYDKRIEKSVKNP
jgi:hypothetical protein